MANAKYPPVVVVDENDHETGSAMLADVWKNGLYHRVVAVFIEDDQGRMLLQLRSPNVKIYPNRWDQAAGGHVDEGQSYEQAAHNELAEELGLQNITLKELGTFRTNSESEGGRIINQFERVYLAQVPHDIMLKPGLDEVKKLQWFASSELKTKIVQRPEEFTPGLLHGLRTYFPAFQ